MSINTNNLFENEDFIGKVYKYKPFKCPPEIYKAESYRIEDVKKGKICLIALIASTLIGTGGLLYVLRKHRKIQILTGVASLGVLGLEIWQLKKLFDSKDVDSAEEKEKAIKAKHDDLKEGAEEALSAAVKGVEQFIATGELKGAKHLTKTYQEEVTNVDDRITAVNVLQKWIKDTDDRYLVSSSGKDNIEESCISLGSSYHPDNLVLVIWAANHYLEKRYQDDPSYTLSVEEKRNLRLLAIACIACFFFDDEYRRPTLSVHQCDQELKAHIKEKRKEFMKVAKKVGSHLFSVDILGNMEEEYKIPVFYKLEASIKKKVIIQGEEQKVLTDKGQKLLSVYDCFEEGTPLPSQKDA